MMRHLSDGSQADQTSANGCYGLGRANRGTRSREVRDEQTPGWCGHARTVAKIGARASMLLDSVAGSSFRAYGEVDEPELADFVLNQL